MRITKNSITQKMKFLFFYQKSSQKILKLNHEMLILNATYKTNKYKLPLFVITDVTTLNNFFYVNFTFIKSKYISNYVWVMKQLKALYNELDIPYSKMLLTNAQETLINAYVIIFPNATHMLYI